MEAMICTQCGGGLESHIPKCPYCGTEYRMVERYVGPEIPEYMDRSKYGYIMSDQWGGTCADISGGNCSSSACIYIGTTMASSAWR